MAPPLAGPGYIAGLHDESRSDLMSKTMQAIIKPEEAPGLALAELLARNLTVAERGGETWLTIEL